MDGNGSSGSGVCCCTYVIFSTPASADLCSIQVHPIMRTGQGTWRFLGRTQTCSSTCCSCRCLSPSQPSFLLLSSAAFASSPSRQHVIPIPWCSPSCAKSAPAPSPGPQPLMLSCAWPPISIASPCYLRAQYRRCSSFRARIRRHLQRQSVRWG